MMKNLSKLILSGMMAMSSAQAASYTCSPLVTGAHDFILSVNGNNRSAVIEVTQTSAGCIGIQHEAKGSDQFKKSIYPGESGISYLIMPRIKDGSCKGVKPKFDAILVSNTLMNGQNSGKLVGIKEFFEGSTVSNTHYHCGKI